MILVFVFTAAEQYFGLQSKDGKKESKQGRKRRKEERKKYEIENKEIFERIFLQMPVQYRFR